MGYNCALIRVVIVNKFSQLLSRWYFFNIFNTESLDCLQISLYDLVNARVYLVCTAAASVTRLGQV